MRLTLSTQAALGGSILMAWPCLALPAHAQVSEGLMEQEAATEGNTDVAEEGFQTVDIQEADHGHETELKISAGGLLATGNSRLSAFTASNRFRARREQNQLSASLAGNYARTAADADADLQTTVSNLQGMLRYDRFVSEKLAFFLAVSGRHDRFQGLQLRLNVDPGVAYYFLNAEKHRFWGEVGYDLQFDVRREDAVTAALAEGQSIDYAEVRHGARLFLGYENNLSEAVSFDTGIEYLQGVPDTEFWRLGWGAGLTSSIGSNFSVATTLGLRYDNTPLPGIERLDTTTAVNLVYQLL